MEQKTDTINPSEPLENNTLEQRLEKNSTDVISINNSIIKDKEMVTYFKDKTHKSNKI